MPPRSSADLAVRVTHAEVQAPRVIAEIPVLLDTDSPYFGVRRAVNDVTPILQHEAESLHKSSKDEELVLTLTKRKK